MLKTTVLYLRVTRRQTSPLTNLKPKKAMKQFLSTTTAVFALAITTFAQIGSIDPTFNPGTAADCNVWTTSIQSDGKIIIGGNFTSYNEIFIV
jgi:hypothetical protein